MVTFYAIAIFNLVFGYFLNLISVDMVALEPVDKIETLSDLLENEKFGTFDVYTVGGLWQELALKTASIGSQEGRLYQRIGQKNIIPITIDAEGVKGAIAMATKFVSGRMVAVADTQVMPIVKSIAGQLLNTDDVDRFHTSKDWFGERLLVAMISESSQSDLVTWSRYKFRQMFQSNLVNHIVDMASYELEIAGSSKYRRLKLMYQKSSEPDTSPPPPFTVLFFSPLLMLCLYVMSIAFMILLLEHFISNVTSDIHN